MNQESCWDNHLKHISVNDVIQACSNPAIFQTELKHELDRFSTSHPRLIEVGCETGVTSLILSDNFEKTFLDLNPKAIYLVEAVAAQLGKRGRFIIGDMFNMSLEDKSFDLLFNAGVVEHFSESEQILFLKEYSRILKDNGLMVLAYPNHYSIPYRFAYLFHRYVLMGHFWPYPPEYKIFDMKNALEQAGLKLHKRKVISKSSIFNWWNFCKPVKKIFMFLDKLLNFEGYLTILFITKLESSSPPNI